MIGDALRLSVGTLSVWPVAPPRRVDARVAGWAMALAPVSVVPVAALCALTAIAFTWAGLSAPICAAVILAGLTLSSRGMHVDGIADFADGLCAGFDRETSLAVMKRSDTGAGGVAAVVLLYLIQFAALSSALAIPRVGAALVFFAVLLSRHGLAWACRAGVPAATGSGLGATVAATVSPPLLGWASAFMSAATLTGIAALGLITGHPQSWAGSVLAAMALMVAVVVATQVVIRIAGRRLGGITGDVLGACVEIAFAATLVVGAAILTPPLA